MRASFAARKRKYTPNRADYCGRTDQEIDKAVNKAGQQIEKAGDKIQDAAKK